MKRLSALQHVQIECFQRCWQSGSARQNFRPPATTFRSLLWGNRRDNHSNAPPRQRRDDIWIPTAKLKALDEPGDATDLLIRAGYLRQAYSGIYHVLPLGLRVQNKLELLIDKHMQSIGGSKISLSSVSSQALWERSGRLQNGSEFFTFSDRKDTKWLLAPTHEEEITHLVSHAVQTPAQLPVRLYQISRKYRDEKRPRGGLLRGREFIMKDLYTFDATETEAHSTYDQVRQAYRNFLDELGVPYIEARADSGNMGGNLSHEYHFPSVAGEDDVISCTSCSYARNEEWTPACSHTVEGLPITMESHENRPPEMATISTCVVSSCRSSLVKAFAPQRTVDSHIVGFNMYSIKAAIGSAVKLDTGVEQPIKAFLSDDASESANSRTVYYVFDQSITRQQALSHVAHDQQWRADNNLTAHLVMPRLGESQEFSLLKQSNGDNCPQCSDGKLKVEKAIEVGHTFHLGTRYSSKLGLTIKSESQRGNGTPVQMGCHGIGVSRLIAAIASSASDNIGLNWPVSIAPYEVVIIVDGQDEARLSAATQLYDTLASSSRGNSDVLLDDRKNVSLGYKLKDADLIGYPIIVIFGRNFTNGQVEIQCRVRGVKEPAEMDKAASKVGDILSSLSTKM